MSAVRSVRNRAGELVRLTVAATLAAAGIGAAIAPADAAMPAFQLPFPCGETWRGSSQSAAHTGWEIDFNWGSGNDDLGKPVVAAAAGTVVTAGYAQSGGYGNYVVIRHGTSGYLTYYAHLKGFAPGLGKDDVVRGGQLIGYVGETSGSYDIKPHLHFELRSGSGIVPAYFNGARFGYPEQSLTSRNCGGAGDRDVTGDGRSDLVAAHSGGYLYRYAGSGTGGLSGTRLGPGWGSTRLLSLADLTGDGLADLLAVRTDGALYRYSATGTGGFRGPVKIGSRGWGVFRLITAADFNNDGRGDVLAVHHDGGLYRYAGTSSGGLASWGGRVGGGWKAFRLATSGDVNGDGNADLVAVRTDGSLWFLRGKGNGSFAAGVRIGPRGWGVFRAMTAADYTGDGRADVFAVHGNGDLYRYPGQSGGTLGAGRKAGSGWGVMRLINT